MTSQVSPAALLLTAVFVFLASTNPMLIALFNWANARWGWRRPKKFTSLPPLPTPPPPPPTQDAHSIPYVRGLPWFGCIDFFSRRNDFIQECLQMVNDKLCEIHLPKFRAFIVTGDSGRQAFFHHKTLSLERGYSLLHGGKTDFRKIKGIPATADGAEFSYFLTRFNTLMRPDALARRYTFALDDIDNAQAALSSAGVVSAFEMCYNLTLQLTIRMVCPDDIAGDPVHTACIGSLLSVVTEDATALSFVFPWISVVKQIKTVYHGQKLWRALRDAIRRREGEAIDDTDCISFMMEKGDSVEQMISFIIGSVILGLLNTSRVQAWLLIYFNIYPEWKAKVMQEMNDFIADYGATPESLHNIPFQAWDSALPTLEACTSELIRIMGDGALLRRNIGGDFDIDGRTIPVDSFLIYPMSDFHHNPALYPDPKKFNPARAPHKDPHFVGWGTGRHPCSGRRTALMLIKLISTHFLLRFQYDVVDRSGSVLKDIPKCEQNTLHLPALAKGESAFLKYSGVSSFGWDF